MLDEVTCMYKGGVRCSKFYLLKAARRGFFNSYALMIQAAFRNPFKDPADAIYRARKVEVRFIVLNPPELHLIGFQLRDKQGRVTRLRYERRQWPLRRQMKIARGVNDISGLQQYQRIELALLHFFLHLSDLLTVPVRLKAIMRLRIRHCGRH